MCCGSLGNEDYEFVMRQLTNQSIAIKNRPMKSTRKQYFIAIALLAAAKKKLNAWDLKP